MLNLMELTTLTKKIRVWILQHSFSSAVRLLQDEMDIQYETWNDLSFDVCAFTKRFVYGIQTCCRYNWSDHTAIEIVLCVLLTDVGSMLLLLFISDYHSPYSNCLITSCYSSFICVCASCLSYMSFISTWNCCLPFFFILFWLFFLLLKLIPISLIKN